MIGKFSANLPAKSKTLATIKRYVEESRRHCGNCAFAG
jgi:hypothetical protein